MFYSGPTHLEVLRSKISSAVETALKERSAFEIPSGSRLTQQKIREVARNPLGTSAPMLVETLRILNLRQLLDEVLISQGQTLQKPRKK